MNTTSNFGKLNFLDIAISLLWAAILPVIAMLLKDWQAGSFIIDYPLIVHTALAGFLGGLGINSVTNSQGVPLTKEPLTLTSAVKQIIDAVEQPVAPVAPVAPVVTVDVVDPVAEVAPVEASTAQ